MARRCDSCGHPTPRTARFCGRCGAVVATTSASTTGPEPASRRRDRPSGRRRGARGRSSLAALARRARHVRPVPAAVLVVTAVVLVAGLRSEPAPSGVSTGRPGGAGAERATERPEPLPVLRACVDAPPPCSSDVDGTAADASAEDPTGGAAAEVRSTRPILREDEHRLRAYDASGATLWSVSLTGDAVTSRGPDGGVLVVEPGGRVRLLDGASGVARWEIGLPFAEDWALEVTGDDRTIAVAAAPPSPTGAPRVIRVIGLSPSDGAVLWVHLANTRAPVLTAEATEEVILLTGVLGEGVLSAIDTATGLLRWQADLGTPLRVLAGDGTVLAAGDDRLAVLDAATGSRALDVRVPSGVSGLVAVSPTGAVIDTPRGPLRVALPES